MTGLICDLLEDWVGRFLLILMAAIAVMAIVSGVAIWQTVRFNQTHECVDTRRYWRRGHMVGVVGKGGHWQAAGWRYYCARFDPPDEPPKLYLD